MLSLLSCAGLTSVAIWACGDEASEDDVSTDRNAGTDASGGGGDSSEGLCDTDCLADRMLAMYLGLEPGCRCDSSSGSVILDQQRIDGCALFHQQQAAEFVSPRACVAQYYSEPAAAAALDSYLTCREERTRTRGPCIMALQAGDSCEACPEFFEGGVDPCYGPDSGEEYFELCAAEMYGRR
jgi:hypothetical protein